MTWNFEVRLAWKKNWKPSTSETATCVMVADGEGNEHRKLYPGGTTGHTFQISPGSTVYVTITKPGWSWCSGGNPKKIEGIHDGSYLVANLCGADAGDPEECEDTMTQQVVTLDCVADTFTTNADPSATRGGREFIAVSGWSTTPGSVAWGWLRFDATDLPSGFSWDDVTGVELKLYLQDMDVGAIADSTQFYFRRPNSDWDEYTLAWNSHPLIGSIFNSQEKYLDRNTDRNTYIAFQFSKYEIGSATRDNKIEFVISCSLYDPYHVAWFGSKESAQPPLLEITYTAPETIMTNVLCYDAEVSEGETYYPVAKLQEAPYPYTPVSGKLIDFSIDGVYRCSGITSATGEAYCNPGAGSPTTDGYYTILATWNGDATHEASSGSGTLHIEAGMCTQTITVQTSDGSAVYATIDYGDGESQGFNTTFTRTHEYKEGDTYTVTASATGIGDASETFVACTGSTITLTLTRPEGLKITIPASLAGMTLYVMDATSIPLTDTWWNAPFTRQVIWNNISAGTYFASDYEGSNDPPADSSTGLNKGDDYAVFAGISTTAFYPSSIVHRYDGGETSISLTSSYVGALSDTLCTFFGISDAECSNFMLTSVSDAAFAVEEIKIITQHKNLADEPTTPGILDYALLPVAIFGILTPGISEAAISKALGKKSTELLDIARTDDTVKRLVDSDPELVMDFFSKLGKDDARLAQWIDALKSKDYATAGNIFADVRANPGVTDAIQLSRLGSWIDAVKSKITHGSAEPAGKVITRSKLGAGYFKKALDGLRNHTPWRDPPMTIDEVLSTDDLTKLIDDGELERIVGALNKEGRYIDFGELFRYTMRKDPTFFKEGHSNAVMKTFEHFDNEDDIARHIQRLTPEQAAARRQSFTDLKNTLKEVLGDAKGDDVYKKLGLDAIDETAELNSILFRSAKRQYEDLYSHALTKGATESEAGKLAKLGIQMRMEVPTALAGGAVTDVKGFWGWIMRHKLISGIAAGWLFMMGPWYTLDNAQFIVYVLREAGQLDPLFGGQWDDWCEQTKTAYFDLKDAPCSAIAQQNFIAAVSGLNDLKEYAESLPPIPTSKIEITKETLKMLYGTSIGRPNEYLQELMDLTISMRQHEYLVLTQSCDGDPVEPPWIIPYDQVLIPNTFVANIVDIKDGDSVLITSDEISFPEGSTCDVRILGIDTIEGANPRNKEPYQITRQTDKLGGSGEIEKWFPPSNSEGKVLYDDSKRFMATICYGTVTITTDPNNQWGKYKRLLCVIEKNSLVIGREMLKEGYGAIRLYSENTAVDDHVALYTASETVGKIANLGVWQWYGETGWIECTSTYTGANVYLDDTLVGETEGNELEINPVHVGEHTVRFEKYIGDVLYECTTSVSVDEGSGSIAECEMAPLVNVGNVECTTSPTGAQIWVGSDYKGTTKKTISLPTGSITITFKKSGYRDCNIPVTVIKDDLIPAHCDLTEIPLPPPPEGCEVATDKASYTVGEEALITYTGAPSDGVLKTIKPDGVTTKNVWAVSGGGSKNETFNEEGEWRVELSGTGCSKTVTINVSGVSPTKATYTINDVTYGGIVISSVQIWVDGLYTHHMTPEILTFGPGEDCAKSADYFVACELGTHTIELKKTDYPTWSETIILAAGDVVVRDPVLGEEPPVTDNICSYISSVGGADGVKSTTIVNAILGYKNVKDLGFTVSVSNIAGLILYYKKQYSAGDTITGCTGLYRLADVLRRVGNVDR